VLELTPNFAYRFRVRCINRDGIASAWSAITPAVCTKTIAPAAPTRPFLLAKQDCAGARPSAGAGAGAEQKVMGTPIGWSLTKTWSKFGPVEGFEIESRLLNPKRAAEQKGTWKTVPPHSRLSAVGRASPTAESAPCFAPCMHTQAGVRAVVAGERMWISWV